MRRYRRDVERRCAVCDRRLDCQRGTGREKPHNHKIPTGGNGMNQLVSLFCSRNDFQILNTFFKLPARRLYTWRSPDQTTRNQIDYIICKTRWRSSVRRVTTLPGADCGTDHNLLIADVTIKLMPNEPN